MSSPSSRRAATDERSRLQFAESMKWYARVRERLVVEKGRHIACTPFRVVFGQASPNPVVYCFPVGVCYNSVMRRLGSEVIQAQMGGVVFPFSLVAIAILVGTQLTALFPRPPAVAEVEIVGADWLEELREIVRLREDLAWWNSFSVGVVALVMSTWILSGRAMWVPSELLPNPTISAWMRAPRACA